MDTKQYLISSSQDTKPLHLLKSSKENSIKRAILYKTTMNALYFNGIRISLIPNLIVHKKYSQNAMEYQQMQINTIIYNKNTHHVSVFKDNMIFEYEEEFIKRFYSKQETLERIPKIANYYKNYLTFFCHPTFRNFEVNALVQQFGDDKAEVYYQMNYGNDAKPKAKENFDRFFDLVVKNYINGKEEHKFMRIQIRNEYSTILPIKDSNLFEDSRIEALKALQELNPISKNLNKLPVGRVTAMREKFVSKVDEIKKDFKKTVNKISKKGFLKGFNPFVTKDETKKETRIEASNLKNKNSGSNSKQNSKAEETPKKATNCKTSGKQSESKTLNRNTSANIKQNDKGEMIGNININLNTINIHNYNMNDGRLIVSKSNLNFKNLDSIENRQFDKTKPDEKIFKNMNKNTMKSRNQPKAFQANTKISGTNSIKSYQSTFNKNYVRTSIGTASAKLELKLDKASKKPKELDGCHGLFKYSQRFSSNLLKQSDLKQQQNKIIKSLYKTKGLKENIGTEQSKPKNLQGANDKNLNTNRLLEDSLQDNRKVFSPKQSSIRTDSNAFVGYSSKTPVDKPHHGGSIAQRISLNLGNANKQKSRNLDIGSNGGTYGFNSNKNFNSDIRINSTSSVAKKSSNHQKKGSGYKDFIG